MKQIKNRLPNTLQLSSLSKSMTIAIEWAPLDKVNFDAVLLCSHRPDCEEDAYEATGAESSSDEGEDAGPSEVHSEPHPPTKILYETAYNTS